MPVLRFAEFKWFILESSQNLTEDSQVDIRSVAQGKIKNVSDEQKQRLIENRKPRKGFEFPAREYTDNRRPDGKMNCYCNPECLIFTNFWPILNKKMEYTACLVFFFRPNPKMVLEQQNLSRHLIQTGGKLQTIYSAMLTNVSIIRRLIIGSMRFLIHRTIYQFVLINEWQIVLPKRLKETGDFWNRFYVR